MAADQASRHNSAVCAFCSAQAQTFAHAHVCAACGSPQPLCGSENYFSALGLPIRFGLDAAVVEKRFYEVSRVLHPDRFSTAAPELRRNSMDRMTLLNKAYRTLKDPLARRRYVLGLASLGTQSQKKQIPMELADSWFELQDTLAEDSEHAGPKLKIFEEELRTLKQNKAALYKQLEEQADSSGDPLSGACRPILEKLARELESENYLSSLTQDVERIKKRLSIT